MFYSRDKFTGKIMSFNEFCLSESFRPLYIEFGTDTKNGEWYEDNKNDCYWTFIRYEKYYYCIILDFDGNVGFATSEIFDNKIFSSWEGVADNFDFDERKTSSAAKVFSYVMYVITKGLEKYRFTEFYFSGQHEALGTIYKTMIKKNKYFLDSLEKRGFKFDREENGNFYFKKI